MAAVFAQDGWPPVYVIETDTATVEVDTAHRQLLEDPQGKLSFAQVQRSTGFRYGKKYDPNRQAHVYWLRMRLRNGRANALGLYLLNYSHYFDMYWLDSTNRWQHQRAGYLVPRSQLPAHKGDREANRLSLRLAPGQETTVYLHMENAVWSSPLRYISAYIQTEEGRKNEVFHYIQVRDGWKKFLFAGIAIGILVLAIGYNWLIFFSTRERVYLYFGICLLFFLLDRAETQPYIQTGFFAEQPYFFALLFNFTFVLFFVFFVQSIRRFIQPGPALHTLNRMTTISLGVTAALFVLTVTLSRYTASLDEELTITLEVLIRVTFALCLLITYRVVRQGRTDARYILLAILPLFVWWLYTFVDRTSAMYYADEANGYLIRVPYAETICFAWMIIFFSGALIHRYNLTRQQVVQQAIEREQLDKEREIERSRLIASQNERLEQQVRERTAELQQSLKTLRATQNQLVHKEKLASLGELTAGIAHEIQNPLNFVNNFAEVSVELLAELREERGKPQPDEAFADELLTDLGQNLEKINHHGRRAGAIVRGMLEHSRASTGEKQPTNLNALADEYLRLAYYGLRAKDKTFTCQLLTDFDPTMPNITVASQDIGRVLLNLGNNAFYAVQERSKAQSAAYQPTVWVRTHVVGSPAHVIEICVRDNGTGIPDAVKQKIFQPFFTTKPTGQGTGLGLSLSYDIVTKGHAGELTVESQEGEGTEFVIRLPMK